MIAKLRLLFLLGIVMLFLPFLGIPNTWKTVIAVAIGVFLIFLSITIRRNYHSLRHVMRNLEHTVAEHIHHE